MCCCPIVWRARPSSIATNPLTRAALQQLGSKPRPFGAIRSHRDVAAGIASVPPLASSAPLSHFRIMHFDFSLFRERLAYCMTHDQLCASIGLGSRRRVDLGLKALDI